MKTIMKYQFLIICISVFCFIVSLAGCYSMQPETIDAKDISHQKEYEIYSLTLKDSSKINIIEPNYINFIKGFPDSVSTFVYSLHSNKTKTGVTTDTVTLYRVSKVEIGKSQYDEVASTIAVAIVALVLVGMILILYSSAFNKDGFF